MKSILALTLFLCTAVSALANDHHPFVRVFEAKAMQVDLLSGVDALSVSGLVDIQCVVSHWSRTIIESSVCEGDGGLLTDPVFPTTVAVNSVTATGIVDSDPNVFRNGGLSSTTIWQLDVPLELEIDNAVLGKRQVPIALSLTPRHTFGQGVAFWSHDYGAMPYRDETITVNVLFELVRGHTFLPGDANRDDEISFADFLAVSTNFGQDGGWAEGDFNNDGGVGFQDFLVVSSNFGMRHEEPLTESFVDTTAVPEPGTQTLIFLGFLSLAIVRSSRIH